MLGLLYAAGFLAQLMAGYDEWLSSGGLSGGAHMVMPQLNPFICWLRALSWNGLKAITIICLGVMTIWTYIKLHDRFSNHINDPRGFSISKTGTYGTAGWMSERELRQVLKLTTPEKAEGMILGEYHGQLVCLPKNTTLNRHTAVFGASGTMKSRAVVRNMIFQSIRMGESVLVSDPKSELYNDTSELLRKNGYEVRVFNLIDPNHSDAWNCMAGLNGDSMMAQTLTNVIISNTSSGRGDHFWDNGETNLLKALILYVSTSVDRTDDQKNLWEVYDLLVNASERTLFGVFSRLPSDHPAKAPFSLYAQASDTVRAGILLGLGTRLQILQNAAIARLVSGSDIDLTAPGARKCAYFIIISDQENSMAFLSSLFFSYLFIKLVRFADSSPGGRCPVPVNLIMDEFNNIGRIGGGDGSDFARTLSVIRSRAIRVTIAVQSLGQLQNRYPNNLWAEIIGNCDIQLMLGCTDDVTADYFSARSGDLSIEVGSTMTTKQTIALAQVIPQYRETQGHGRRKLLTPDEVLRLPSTEMLAIIRGQNILQLTKFDYTRHPMFAELSPVSIQDYCPAGHSPDDTVSPRPAEIEKPKTVQRKFSLSSAEVDGPYDVLPDF